VAATLAHLCRTPANGDYKAVGGNAPCMRPCETVVITIDWHAKLKCDAALGTHDQEIKALQCSARPRTPSA